MQGEILKVLLENGDVKVLIVLMAYFIKTFGNKVDRLADSVANIHRDLAIIFEKNDTNEAKTDKNSLDILILREKHHDLVNNHIVRIEANSIRVEELEKKVK